jgi:hypothetical protein
MRRLFVLAVLGGLVAGPRPAVAAPSLRAAAERGDVDEVARQGVLAGPAVVERLLASPDRIDVLAAIVAAPEVTDAASLLLPLATVAGGRDRRTAVPAARAARAIARALARRAAPDPSDDVADDDHAAWQEAWHALARRDDRWIEVRLAALEVTVALAEARHLEPGLDADLADPDPALRRAAVELIAAPTPPALRPTLARLVRDDPEARVGLAAAAVLCGDLVADPAPAILDALGAPGLARIRALLADGDLRAIGAIGAIGAIRDAARCLAADPAAASQQALAALRKRATGPLRDALSPR